MANVRNIEMNQVIYKKKHIYIKLTKQQNILHSVEPRTLLLIIFNTFVISNE